LTDVIEFFENDSFTLGEGSVNESFETGAAARTDSGVSSRLLIISSSFG